MTVDSKLGEGTHHMYLLPRSLEAEQVQLSNADHGLKGGTETILLVGGRDDDVRENAVQLAGRAWI